MMPSPAAPVAPCGPRSPFGPRVPRSSFMPCTRFSSRTRRRVFSLSDSDVSLRSMTVPSCARAVLDRCAISVSMIPERSSFFCAMAAISFSAAGRMSSTVFCATSAGHLDGMSVSVCSGTPTRPGVAGMAGMRCTQPMPVQSASGIISCAFPNMPGPATVPPEGRSYRACVCAPKSGSSSASAPSDPSRLPARTPEELSWYMLWRVAERAACDA
mmetsp:Transcript_23705/g.56583  ORF Transcript_23705/g.56583 Transcript_23705/m.56583 type:complete len:214 (-) Transcript_23705:336-977(-)